VNRLLRETKLFDAKLGPIDGAGNVGAYLIGLVVSKTVAEPKQENGPKKSEDKTDAAETESKNGDKEET
jgi:vacuolar protein sorting-associated protein 54